MNNHKTIGKLLGFVVTGLLALGIMPNSTFAAEKVYNLRAQESQLNLPGGKKVVTWAFAEIKSKKGKSKAKGKFKIPGPMLTVPPGDSLRINLTNNLTVPVSIMIPGQPMPTTLSGSGPVYHTSDPFTGRIRSFVPEAAPNGGTQTYIWPNLKPGTYLYHSGTHPAVQVQMGLYGAITKDTAKIKSQKYAYGIAYDKDVIILYSEIDPALHAAVDGGTYGTAAYPSTMKYEPKYFLINGKPFDMNNPRSVGMVTAGGPVLLRFLNAGLKSHVPTFLGLRMSVIAEDGNLYPYPKDQYSVLLPAGKTIDAFLTPTSAGTYPIFDRRLDLTNGAATGGGMFTYLQVN